MSATIRKVRVETKRRKFECKKVGEKVELTRSSREKKKLEIVDGGKKKKVEK